MVWTLTHNPDEPDNLIVGEDCGYYEDGHTTARIERDNDVIFGIRGPGDELYTRVSEHTSSLDDLPGSYNCLMYTGEDRNDWHLVTITKKEFGTFEWRNRADVVWTIRADTRDKLLVDEDCPYHTDGHTEAFLEFNDDGEIIGIRGPSDELYTRVPTADDIVGNYECHEYPVEEMNDYHYVTIFKKESTDSTSESEEVKPCKLIWENRADVRWKLKYKPDSIRLKVKKSCPYYEDGHRLAEV